MIVVDNKNQIEKIENVELFLLDLDGTVYLEDEIIPGVKEFTDYLSCHDKKYVFITNNSSLSTAMYIRKIEKFGIKVTAENILTSGFATGTHILASDPHAKAYVVGTASLKEELMLLGVTVCETYNPEIDYLIVGFDTELSYDKLRTACMLLQRDARFIATNPDLVCPVKNKKYIPDCGSICQMLINATGVQPKYIGKPHTIMIDIIKKRFGMHSGKMAVVGDRLYTDIALGCNAGLFTICVLSGESTLNEIMKSPYKPDLVISSVKFLNDTLRSRVQFAQSFPGPNL